ncbi:MAG: hypothetical protein IKJ11_06985 [Clostridia bacterium]|nr:hypothetical protein [Clostridia bacterium]
MMNRRPTKKSDTQRMPFKRLRGGMSRLLADKRFTLLISLVIAVLSWSALVASDSTLTRPKTFTNVSVNVNNESALKSRGFIVMDDIKELVPGVRMTVEVTQQNYDRVTSTSYNPHFDLSKIDSEGVHTLPLNFSSQLYGPVIDCQPNSVTVNVERYITRRVPVVLELTGFEQENIYLDSYRTDPNMLSVSGPQSLVSSVARAVAKLELSSLSLDRMSDRTALDVELQDTAGNVIVSDKLQITNQTVITDSVIVETEAVPAAMVPIAVESLVVGEPAEGYELVGISIEQDALRVAAKEELLGKMEFITTETPLDITGATATMDGYVKIKRLSGIENALPGELAVTAEIAEKTIERTLRDVEIEIQGVRDGLKAKLSDKKSTVQLTGGYAFIQSLAREDVHLFVDALGLEAGSHTLSVQIRVDNAQEFTCALSVPEVAVTLVDTAQENK